MYPWPALYRPNLGYRLNNGFNPLGHSYGYFPQSFHGAYPGFNYAPSNLCRGRRCVDPWKSSLSSNKTNLCYQDPTVSTTFDTKKTSYCWKSGGDGYQKQYPSVPVSNCERGEQGSLCSQEDRNWNNCMYECSITERPQGYPATVCTHMGHNPTVQNTLKQRHSSRNQDLITKAQTLPKCESSYCQTCPRWVLPEQGYSNVIERSNSTRPYTQTDHKNNNDNNICGDLPESKRPRYDKYNDTLREKVIPVAKPDVEFYGRYDCMKPVMTQIGLLNCLKQKKERWTELKTSAGRPCGLASSNSSSNASSVSSSSDSYSTNSTTNWSSEDRCESYVYPALFRLAQLGTEDSRPWRTSCKSRFEPIKAGKSLPKQIELDSSSRCRRSKRKQTHPVKSVPANQSNFRGVTVRLKTVLGSPLSIQAFFSSRKLWKLYEKKRKQRLHLRMSRGHVRRLDQPKVWQWVNQPKECNGTAKYCASCGTRKTPLWRDAEDGTPLCNACGIRYKKYKVRCLSCSYIPRKAGKHYAKCLNCGGPLKVHMYKSSC